MTGMATGPVLWERRRARRRDRHAQPARGQQRLQRRADRGHAGGAGRARAASPACAPCVIRGNGKHFQAGADLAWINAVRDASREENLRVSRATAEAVRRLNAAPVPTVALVQGGCFGGGTGIIAACDVVVAADNALFSIAEVRWGLTAAPIVPLLPMRSACGSCAATRSPASASAPRRRAASGSRTWSCRSRTSRREGARIVEHLLQNGPEAVAETKAWILRSAWSDSTTRRSPRWSRAMPPSASRPRPPRASPRSPRSAPPGGSGGVAGSHVDRVTLDRPPNPRPRSAAHSAAGRAFRLTGAV